MDDHKALTRAKLAMVGANRPLERPDHAYARRATFKRYPLPVTIAEVL